ncbi:DmpA family aminopeptidase [Arenibaculum pallidiluteum]|uniref:DmpA family aminopeptidase n=1 Tax=Arenibaculum pallidiluteum TaxID=2812559 RepID=UPI001A95CC6A|nr:P1 family peptidase [Arenibaculum pallidiluteum]
MPGTRLARDFGLACGTMPAGPLNAITDVPGVLVGHRTRMEGELRTGFTAVLPHGGNLYRDKVPAAVEVINGFGKSAGLIQVEELGAVETPILLTNTFGVGTGFNALVRHAIAANPDIGRETATVNPVVCECNDGYLSDIQALALTEADAAEALARAAGGAVEQGAVGAGTGMSAFGFKGGIGTASRSLDLDGGGFHLGVLALANFGRPGDLVLPDGRRPVPPGTDAAQGERGSVILVMATDVPLESRQLRRIARRGGAGLARLGAFWGHGSGDIALAFTTACRIRHDEPGDIVSVRVLNESRIDLLFRAAAEATQEAVLNALCAAPRTTGRNGHERPALADWLDRGKAP